MIEKAYYKRFWLELTKDQMKEYFENSPILFKFRKVYEVLSYKGKDWIEYGLREIWQLSKNNGLPYTLRGRFMAFTYEQANKFLERDFFITD